MASAEVAIAVTLLVVVFFWSAAYVAKRKDFPLCERQPAMTLLFSLCAMLIIILTFAPIGNCSVWMILMTPACSIAFSALLVRGFSLLMRFEVEVDLLQADLLGPSWSPNRWTLNFKLIKPRNLCLLVAAPALVSLIAVLGILGSRGVPSQCADASGAHDIIAMALPVLLVEGALKGVGMFLLAWKLRLHEGDSFGLKREFLSLSRMLLVTVSAFVVYLPFRPVNLISDGDKTYTLGGLLLHAAVLWASFITLLRPLIDTMRYQAAVAQNVTSLQRLSTLRELLSMPGGYETLLRFCSAEFTSENLLFHRRVDEFRAGVLRTGNNNGGKPPADSDEDARSIEYWKQRLRDTLAEAETIRGTYLQPNSAFEVNVASGLRAVVQSRLQKLATNVALFVEGGSLPSTAFNSPLSSPTPPKRHRLERVMTDRDRPQQQLAIQLLTPGQQDSSANTAIALLTTSNAGAAGLAPTAPATPAQDTPNDSPLQAFRHLVPTANSSAATASAAVLALGAPDHTRASSTSAFEQSTLQALSSLHAPSATASATTSGSNNSPALQTSSQERASMSTVALQDTLPGATGGGSGSSSNARDSPNIAPVPAPTRSLTATAPSSRDRPDSRGNTSANNNARNGSPQPPPSRQSRILNTNARSWSEARLLQSEQAAQLAAQQQTDSVIATAKRLISELQHVFDEAQEVIADLIQQNSFARFRQSRQFNEFIAAVAEAAHLQAAQEKEAASTPPRVKRALTSRSRLMAEIDASRLEQQSLQPPSPQPAAQQYSPQGLPEHSHSHHSQQQQQQHQVQQQQQQTMTSPVVLSKIRRSRSARSIDFDNAMDPAELAANLGLPVAEQQLSRGAGAVGGSGSAAVGNSPAPSFRATRGHARSRSQRNLTYETPTAVAVEFDHSVAAEAIPSFVAPPPP